MLDSLHIQNYRCLRDLKIPKLGRVNLITGKNNTGKSTLLEAVALYVSKGNLKTLYDFIIDRGDYYIPNPKNDNIETVAETNFTHLSSIYNNETKNITTIEESDIVIKTINSNTEFLKLGLRFDTETIKFSFIIDYSDFKASFPLNDIAPIPYIFRIETNAIEMHFVKSRNLNSNFNSSLWDKISLTDKEKKVIDGLKIIDEKILDINFKENNTNERNAFVRSSNWSEPVNLKKYGDGTNRILSIILALVNCENGTLLIDEFENGLHYSVQEKLWEIIFKLSKDLNVQVFATTHSNDAIDSFGKVLNEQEDKNLGQLIRLDNTNGDIKSVGFDAEVLETAIESNIEIR